MPFRPCIGVPVCLSMDPRAHPDHSHEVLSFMLTPIFKSVAGRERSRRGVNMKRQKNLPWHVVALRTRVARLTLFWRSCSDPPSPTPAPCLSDALDLEIDTTGARADAPPDKDTLDDAYDDGSSFLAPTSHTNQPLCPPRPPILVSELTTAGELLSSSIEGYTGVLNSDHSVIDLAAWRESLPYTITRYHLRRQLKSTRSPTLPPS
ncbi:hypothetical protein CCHR01_12917 [Colletotrichum chrysophilum]|uniref:Uncharacterized protein n=1 Tax=Colletotrichum chrysophilum TaxID=1836956 RepID=A0AAD9AFB9_9PEZI|nr:hypothetical protein CCHR01_12917 [Colletotrichum chrysophilum]